MKNLLNKISNWWKLYRKKRQLEKQINKINKDLHLHRRQAEYLINIPTEIFELSKLNAKRIDLVCEKKNLIKEWNDLRNQKG